MYILYLGDQTCKAFHQEKQVIDFKYSKLVLMNYGENIPPILVEKNCLD